MKAAFAHIGRKGRKPDLMGPRPSRSVSRSRAVSPPSPSPSSPRALDKTPTKADFVIGMKVDEDTSMPIAQPMINAPVDLSASEIAVARIGREVPPPWEGAALGVGWTQVEVADPSPSTPAASAGLPPPHSGGPVPQGGDETEGPATHMDIHEDDNGNKVVPLSLTPHSELQVTAPPSTTPVVPARAESDEERLMRIIGSTVGMALKPLRDDVSRLAGDVNHLTSRVEFIENADDDGGIDL